MTNEKREQARVLEEMLGGYTCLPEHQVNPAQLSRHRRHSAALRAGIAALMREPESTAPDVSEAERPKRLCDYDPVETTVGDMVMRFGFDYTNFKFFAESITKLTAALRAARKREGEAVALLRRVHEKVIQGSFDGVVAVDDFIVRFLAARETTQEQKNEQ